MNVPGGGSFNVGAIQRCYRTTAKQSKSALDIGAQYFEGPGYAGLSCGGKAIGIGSAYENCARSQRECFDDVGAPADAAIHQDFDLTVDRGHNLWKGPQSCRDGVQLPATVIGDYDGGGPFIDCPPRIVADEKTVACDNAEATSTSSIGPFPDRTMFSSLGTPPSSRKDASQPG